MAGLQLSKGSKFEGITLVGVRFNRPGEMAQVSSRMGQLLERLKAEHPQVNESERERAREGERVCLSV